jgi:hypothetical protein
MHRWAVRRKFNNPASMEEGTQYKISSFPSSHLEEFGKGKIIRSQNSRFQVGIRTGYLWNTRTRRLYRLSARLVWICSNTYMFVSLIFLHGSTAWALNIVFKPLVALIYTLHKLYLRPQRNLFIFLLLLSNFTTSISRIWPSSSVLLAKSISLCGISHFLYHISYKCGIS